MRGGAASTSLVAAIAAIVLVGSACRPARTPHIAACDAGDPIGCKQAGDDAFEGHGEPVDHAGAARLYRRACDMKYAAACARLAPMVLRGDGGLQADPAAAASLDRRACDLRDKPACVDLASFPK